MADKLPLELDVALKGLEKARAQIASLQKEGNKSLGNIRVGIMDSSFKAGRAALGQIRKDADQFAKSMEAANARVLAFGTAVGVIEGLRRSFAALIKTTVDVEKALTQISVVAGDDLKKAGISISQFGKQLFQVAKETGQSFDTTNKAALEFTRQGLGLQESLKRTRDALTAVRISGIDVGSAVEGLTAIYNGFNKSGYDTTKILNKLVALDNASAASLTDLIEGMKRAASISQLAGNNLDETAASIAALQEITARGGPVIGNALKSITTRLYSENSIKFLEDFKDGIVQIRDEAGQLLPSFTILKNLGAALKDLPQEEQLQTFTKLGGLYQVNQIAALVQSFEQLNGQASIYDERLKTVKNASDEAARANDQFSKTLSSQFNAVTVQVGELLNKIGEIGLNAPLNNLVKLLDEVQNSLQGVLEGTGPLDKIVQTLVKISGNAIFSAPVAAGGLLIITKIIVGFVKFATEAFRTFTGLNTRAKEQEAIQQSISAYINQSGIGLKGLLSSEQQRLTLAKAISAEWSEQLARANALAAVSRKVAPALYNEGFRSGESGLKKVSSKGLRAASGYLPDLISQEAKDVRNGVGGASPSSKIVVMPDFPYGGGKKGLMVANSSETLEPIGRGQYAILNKDMQGNRAAGGFNIEGNIRNQTGFAPKGVLQNALTLLIKDWVQAGKQGLELSNLIRKAVGDFNLTKDSFKKASKAANEYAATLVVEKKLIAQKIQQQYAAPGGSLAAFGAANRPTTPYAPLPSSFNQSLGVAAAAALTARSAPPSSNIYGKIGAANTSGTFGPLNYTPDPFGVTPKAAGDVTGGTVQRKSFDPEAAKRFAFNAVLVTSVIEGLISTFRGSSEAVDKFANVVSNASLAIAGIGFLNQIGGVSAGSLFGGKGGGGLLGGLAGKFTPLTNALKGLAKFVPIIGQTVISFGLVNSVLKEITGTSVVEYFTGMTDAAERARKKFDEIASGLFSPSGEYKPRSAEERRQSIDQTIGSILVREKAKRENVVGKDAQEEALNLLSNSINNILGSTKTGRSINEQILIPNEAGGFSTDTVTRGQNFLDFSQETVETIRLGLQELLTGSADELRASLKSLGKDKISGKTIDQSNIDEIRKELGRIALQRLVESTNDIEKSLSSSVGQVAFGDILKGLIPNLSGQLPSAIKPNTAKTIDPKVQASIDEINSEINSLIIEGAIGSLEAQIKSLEFRASGNVSESEKNSLLNNVANARRSILANQLDQLAINNEIKARKISSNGEDPLKIKAELAKLNQEYSNQVNAIKDSQSALRQETDERNRSFNSLEKFNSSLNSIQGLISTLGVRSAFTDAQGTRLRAQASNPSLGILTQESFQRRINANAISGLETSRTTAAAERAAEYTQNQEITDLNKRAAAEKESTDKFIARNAAIDAEISAINESTKQIGAFKSSMTTFNDAILEFNRSLGQSRGQNQFNLFQATDASSISQGLISEQVYNAAGVGSNITPEQQAQGALASFIADQNALLNEQFKIKTASSQAEKLDLETQLKLTKELLDIKTQALDPAEKQQKIEEAINRNLQERRKFGFGVRQATSSIQDEINNFGANFGKTATEGFRDGLVGAMQAAVSQTDDLKTALLDVALTFANKLRDAAFNNLANILTNSLFKEGGSGGNNTGNIVGGIVGAIGGLFTKKATGGQIKGGSGVRDDVPTLLMGGEYVINKKAVQAYGKGFFDSLNRGTVGQMADGGFYAPGIRGQGTIRGKEDLLSFATQTATSGKGDVISSLASGAAIASLEPESLRLSNFARFGDSPIINATQEAKDQAFSLYLGQLDQEKQYQEQLDAIKKAQKAKKKEFLTSLALAVVGAGLSYGFGGGAGAAGKAAGSAATTGTQRYYDVATGLLKTGAKAAISSYSGGGGGYGVPYANAAPYVGQQPLSGANVLKSLSDIVGVSAGYSNSRMINTVPFASYGGYNNPLFNRINVNGRYYNSGGYAGGNGDTVPAMLSNKEFVLNSSAANRIGDKNLYALNSGLTPSGGGEDNSEKVISKLDELIQKTIGASNINVTVSMDSSGGEKSSQDSSGNQQDNSRILSQRIKEAVVSVIREEQRPGGLLTSTRR